MCFVLNDKIKLLPPSYKLMHADFKSNKNKHIFID